MNSIRMRWFAGLAFSACVGAVCVWLLLRARHQSLVLSTAHWQLEKAHLLRKHERLRHYAEHDDLTGLWNRRIIVERLRQEVARAGREHTLLGVVLVDLDHFKAVNDHWGHSAGDLVLRQTAAILQRAVRTYDWVGRYGGEEFLLILPGATCPHASRRADALRCAIARTQFQFRNHVLHITASLGVVCSRPVAPRLFIETADAALYRAKDAGRNCVVLATET